MRTMLAILVVGLGLTLEITAYDLGIEPDKVKLVVKEVQINELNWQDSYPDHSLLRGVSNGGEAKWLRIGVRFQLTHEQPGSRDRYARARNRYLDSLRVQWKVALGMNAEDARDPDPEHSVRLRRTVEYMNVVTGANGEDHWALVFIPPETLARYTDGRLPEDQIWCEIRFSAANRTQERLLTKGEQYYAEESKEGRNEIVREARRWTETEEPKLLENQLLNRYETPWSWASDGVTALMRIKPSQD